jgi:hypothetical protein
MASIGNYASALAEAAKKTVTGSISGIGAAIKGAARSEMPGINSAYSFAEALKSSANSRSNKNDKDEKSSSSKSSSSASTNTSSDSSNFNSAVVRELQLINASIIEQTRLLRYQVDSAKTKSQYDEENAREQALRDSKLLDAINNIGSKGGGRGGGGGNEEGPGIGSALASGAAEGIMDRILGGRGGGRGGKDKGDGKDSGKAGGKSRRGGIGGKLLKGTGAVGLGLGAYMAYDRVSNGGESIAGVAKDLAPGAIGATVGGLVGMIGGPIGVAIGSAIGGAIGDSDFGHKMFETILPDLENYGKIFSQKFQEVSASVTKIFDDFVPTFNNIKDTITSSFTTATDYVVSAFSGIRKSVESSFGEVKNWFTNLKFPDLGLGQVTRDPKLAKEVNAEMNAPANQAGNILGNVPNPMGGKAAKQAAMRAANANAATTSAVPAPIAPIATPIEPPKENTTKPSNSYGKNATKNALYAKQFFESQGWTPEQAAGIVGNLQIESGQNLKIDAVGDSGKAYGIGQWHPDRQAKFEKVFGKPIRESNLTEQLQFIQWELNNNEKKAGNALRTATTAEQAAVIFDKQYERSSGDATGKRALMAAGLKGGPLNVAEPVTIAVAKTPQSPGFNSARDSQAAYDAMPTTPVFTGPGFGSYKEGPNPEADTSFSGSKIPENPQLKVSPLTQKMEEVRTEIRKATDATIKVASAIGKDTIDNLKDLTKSGARTANAVAPRNRPISPILKTPQQIIAETNASFAKEFQKAIPKAFNLALSKALFPKGVGVSQQAASGALFRGQQLNNIFGISKGINKLSTSLFGKQYGGMFAPALNNLATGYLEAGARAGGRLLFGMIGGMDAEKSNILTGQILGNYARGNKKLAVEQLLYGTTGVATGYETVFAKYGFKNPTEGVNYMANTLGAAVSDPVGRFMDPNAKASEWIDPRTGKKVSLNSTSSFTTDAYGRYNVPSSENKNNAAVGPTWTSGYDREPTVTPIVGGDNALVIRDEQLNEIAKKQAWLQEDGNAQRAEAEIRRQTDAAEAKYATESSGQGIIGKLEEIKTAISEGRIGSGSTAGGSLAFPGFNPKSPLGQVGNMALDLGRVALTNTIYKGLGGKGTNPYTTALANFAISTGLKYGGQLAYSYVAPYVAAAGNALAAGAQMAGGYALNALGLTGYSATNVAAPIVNLTTTTGAGDMAGGAAWSAASRGGSAATVDGAAGSVGATIGPTASATEAALLAEGMSVPATTVAGGSTLAALGTAAMEILPPVALFFAVASLFGIFDEDEPYQPDPILERILYTTGNNNIAAISTIYAKDLNYLKDGQDVAWTAICDQLLRIAFNAVKAMEVKRSQIGKPATNIGFDYLGAHVSSNRVTVYFYIGNPKSPLPFTDSYLTGCDFGKLEDFIKLNANEVARQIIKLVESLYKGLSSDQGYENTAKEVAKTAEALQKVNYKTLGSGLLQAVASELDTSITKQDFSQMQPYSQDNTYSNQSGGDVPTITSGGTIDRMVYNQQTKQWVKAEDASIGLRDTGNRTPLSWTDNGMVGGDVIFEPYNNGQLRVMGFDAAGRPIIDLNGDNKLTAEDFISDQEIIKTLPTATVSSLGNYIVKQSAIAAEIATSKPKTDTTSGDTTLVNSGNKITNNNNSTSTTVIKRTDTLDVLRSVGAQTAVPIG